MNVLAIDPGTRLMGFAIAQSMPFRVLEVGVIKTGTDTLEKKFVTIYDALKVFIDQYKVSQVVIEKAFFHKNVLSALKIGMSRGIVYLAAAKGGAEVFEVSPNEVKKTVTGNGHASKEEVSRCISLLTKINSFPSEDASDALAIAYTFINTQAFNNTKRGDHNDRISQR